MKLDNLKLEVPYYSQYIDISDPFWMLRGCGAVSLKMVLDFHRVPTPDLVMLCNELKDRGGYHMENGWIHDQLVEYVCEKGMHAERKEGLTSLKEILNSLENGNPVIASVEKRVLEQKRFHMIVVTGYENGMIIYHDPEYTNKERGQNRSCTQAEFMNYWRGMVILISKII
ncbi:MAG: hypothetical protein JWN37_922 [Candidatus Nomurabacteria bacterium]|nr:hypothetical protein [Candidatus Nomurabacteria bacterium]